jgi:hypothetical protein
MSQSLHSITASPVPFILTTDIVEESSEARRGRDCHGCSILPDIPDRQNKKDKSEWI